MSHAGADSKNIFVVLGMARTGTSAISRALKVFGIDLGASLTAGNAAWNPTGFWEDADIVYGINGKIFADLHFAPYGLQTIPDEALSRHKIGYMYDAAQEVLSRRFANVSSFGFKDPSTIKTLPFWRGLFAEMHMRDHYIIALRNPLAAARSYQKLTGCELELGMMLWSAHLLQAMAATQAARRMVVSYDLLVQDPRQQLERISKAFHLDNLNEQEAQYYASEFIDKSMNRFQADYDEFRAHPALQVMPLCLEIYECLLMLARDEIAFDSPEFTQRWQNILTEYQALEPFCHYLDRCLKKRNNLRRQLKDIHKSILWKLCSPLVLAENYFRRWRKLRKRAMTAYV